MWLDMAAIWWRGALKMGNKKTIVVAILVALIITALMYAGMGSREVQVVKGNDSLLYVYKIRNDSLNNLIKSNKAKADSMIDVISSSKPKVVKQIVLRTVYKVDSMQSIGDSTSDSVCYTENQNRDIAAKLIICDEKIANDSLEMQKCRNEVSLVVDTSANTIKIKDEEVSAAKKSVFKSKVVASLAMAFAAVIAVVAVW